MRARKKENKEEHEFYPTPIDAIELARPLLDKNKKWWEPCAGDGRILKHFDNVIVGTDINPRSKEIQNAASLITEQWDLLYSDYYKGFRQNTC